MGAARLKEREPDALTMTAHEAIEAARVFPRATVVPVHSEGWTHFTEGRNVILKASAMAALSFRLRLLEPGRKTTVEAFTTGRAQVEVRLVYLARRAASAPKASGALATSPGRKPGLDRKMK
jgi:hypothetical protein